MSITQLAAELEGVHEGVVAIRRIVHAETTKSTVDLVDAYGELLQQTRRLVYQQGGEGPSRKATEWLLESLERERRVLRDAASIGAKRTLERCGYREGPDNYEHLQALQRFSENSEVSWRLLAAFLAVETAGDTLDANASESFAEGVQRARTALQGLWRDLRRHARLILRIQASEVLDRDTMSAVDLMERDVQPILVRLESAHQVGSPSKVAEYAQATQQMAQVLLQDVMVRELVAEDTYEATLLRCVRIVAQIAEQRSKTLEDLVSVEEDRDSRAEVLVRLEAHQGEVLDVWDDQVVQNRSHDLMTLRADGLVLADYLDRTRDHRDLLLVAVERYRQKVACGE